MENSLKQTKSRKRLRIKPARILLYTVLILLAVSFIFPYVWLISASFKEPSQIFNTTFSLIPLDGNGKIHFVIQNYISAIEYLNLSKVFGNTMIVCFANTLLNLFFNALAGYAFARIQFKGRDIIFKIMIASMMVPGAIMTIPNLIISRTLVIDDTLLVLILPFVMSVYNVFLMRQQFLGLNKEIEEAAIMDGAGHFRIFFTIALPLVSPMLVVLGITTFMWNYNNFMWALVATQSPDVFTLARSLGSLISAGQNNPSMYPQMLAGSVIVSAPLIVIFFALQRYILKGINIGGVKE
ncbi:MAG: carbohydrate ABC transporter permease [Bacilli bacterium]|jgi:ABC-type glycerol-3-phosphate transport system permease component|nr:carbohydrate ABC transporter permease [Bacilli bacterium]